MQEKNFKVVIDTNIWISYLLTNSFRKLDDLILLKKIQLLVSEELISEFINVVNRPKFHKIFDINDVEIVLNTLNKNSKLVQVKSNLSICSDEKDNFLINLSIDGKADYLITGDNDLLCLKKVGNTETITVKDLFRLLKN